jgi:hypothetical protein
MKLRRHTFAAAFVCAIASSVSLSYAGERCSGKPVVEVLTLQKLPSQLRQLLPAATSGTAGIADRGGQFNATDAIYHDWPMRRFSLAAVGATCAVVAVEHGGRAHNFVLTEYRLTDAVWTSVESHTVFEEPKSTEDLLSK